MYSQASINSLFLLYSHFSGAIYCFQAVSKNLLKNPADHSTFLYKSRLSKQTHLKDFSEGNLRNERAEKE